jgi:integrase/recombinase XerD
MNTLTALNTSLDTTMTDIAGQLAEKSRRVYLNDARHFATWLQSQGLLPATLTRSDIIAYRSYLETSTYAKSTKQRMFSVATRLMKEQFIAGRIPQDITGEVKGFKVNDETTHVALSKKQARDMIHDIDRSTTTGKRDYALLQLIIKTGIRRSEVVALNIGALRMMDGHHVAVIEHAKGDKVHIVKLRVEVKRALDEYIQCLPMQDKESPLFVSIRRGDHPTQARMTDKAVELIVKKYVPLGVEGLTPHGLRSTFITLALESGAPLPSVQYAAGHRDPRTTERYQKRKLNLDNNAVDYLNGF